MRSRVFVTIVVILLALLLGSCSKEQGPGKADLESSLTAQVPKFVTVRDFTIEASENVGDKVDPNYKTRFRAKLQVTEDTFTEDMTQGEVLLLTPIKKIGDTIDVFGKSESKLRNGKWETNTNLDESPFEKIGNPLSAFSASKIIINGTAEEKEFRAAVERSAQATRQAIEARRSLVVDALKGDKPLDGVAYCENTVKFTITIGAFNESNGAISAQYIFEGGSSPGPLEGELKAGGTSVHLKDPTDSLFPCSFTVSLHETMPLLEGTVSCGLAMPGSSPPINCPVDIPLQ